MTKSIAVLNAGSSSIKFSLYALPGEGFDLIARGQVEGLGTPNAAFAAKDADGNALDAAALPSWPGAPHSRARAILAAAACRP